MMDIKMADFQVQYIAQYKFEGEVIRISGQLLAIYYFPCTWNEKWLKLESNNFQEWFQILVFFSFFHYY